MKSVKPFLRRLNERTNGRTRGWARGLGTIGASNLAFLASGFAIHTLLGRFYGPEEYGDFAVVLSASTNLTVVLLGGLSTAVSHHFASHEETTRIWLPPWAFGVPALALAASAWLALRDPSSVLVRVVLVATLFAAALPYQLVLGWLNGQRRYGAQATLTTATALARAGAGVAGVFFHLPVPLVIVLLALAGLLAPAAFLRPAREARTIALDWTQKAFMATAFGSYSLVSLSFTWLATADLLLLGLRSGAAELVGLFGAAVYLGRLPLFAVSSANQFFFPRWAHAHRKGSHELADREWRLLQGAILVGAVAGTLFVYAAASRILAVTYGSTFVPAGRVLLVLHVGAWALVYLNVGANRLMARGALRGLARGLVVALVPYTGAVAWVVWRGGDLLLVAETVAALQVVLALAIGWAARRPAGPASKGGS